jgi:hypothetical protein
MSQSDYLQRKKLAINMKTQTKFPNTLNSGDYTLYTQFNIENTVTNTSKLYNQLLQNGRSKILDMEINPTSCPQFITCKNTQNRPYRKKINPPTFNPNIPIGIKYVKPKFRCPC